MGSSKHQVKHLVVIQYGRKASRKRSMVLSAVLGRSIWQSLAGRVGWGKTAAGNQIRSYGIV